MEQINSSLPLLLNIQHSSLFIFILSEILFKYSSNSFSSFKKSGGRFSRFVPEEFNPTTVKNVGVVAYGKDFYADIDVAALELY